MANSENQYKSTQMNDLSMNSKITDSTKSKLSDIARTSWRATSRLQERTC